MILIIDNYDSFTYNLYQYIGEMSPDVMVIRNDKITLDDIKKINPTHIIISPGPGVPSQAGMSIEIIKSFCGSIPILGVCLGHQAIAEALGGKVVHAGELVHGKASPIKLYSSLLFGGLPDIIKAGRYHSLIVEKESLPTKLRITAETQNGVIMAIEHEEYLLYGVQFHPESILTEYGKVILNNFLDVKQTG